MVSAESIDVELRDNNRWTEIVLKVEVLDDDGELGSVRAGKDAKREVNNLEDFSVRDGEDLGARTNVKNVGFLDPWDDEMGFLVEDGVKNASEMVEEDDMLGTVDGV